MFYSDGNYLQVAINFRHVFYLTQLYLQSPIASCNVLNLMKVFFNIIRNLSTIKPGNIFKTWLICVQTTEEHSFTEMVKRTQLSSHPAATIHPGFDGSNVAHHYSVLCCVCVLCLSCVSNSLDFPFLIASRFSLTLLSTIGRVLSGRLILD